jgi:hypothetical protein
MKDEEAHFRRGVALYKDGDSAGALVEFKRAYEMAPNYHVLFNIGQTYYGLQRYADAMKALQAFLSMGGSDVSPAKRASVEFDIRQLDNHVAQVDVKVNVDGAQIFVDDEPVGTSPLSAPILVSIGRRKITATKERLASRDRFVDVGAGDHASVSLEFEIEAAAPAVSPASAVPVADARPAPVAEGAPLNVVAAAEPAPAPAKHSFPWAWWGATGVLGVATAATGIIALSTRSDLTNQLNIFPANGGTIDQTRTRAKTWGVTSDILLGGTVVAGGIALFTTLSGRGPRSVDVGVAGTGIRIRGQY